MAVAKRRSHGEGTFSFVEAKKLWKARVTLDNGKRKTRYFKNQKEARDWVLSIRQAAREGRLVDHDKISVAEFLDRYLADYARHAVRPSTFQSYSGLIQRHIVPELGRIRLAQLRPDHLQALYVQKLAAGLSQRTVQYLHGLLHRSLNKALRWGLVTRNVANQADAPSAPKQPMQTWDRAQVRRFLASLQGDRWSALYHLACGTGMRQGELLALQWQNVDLDSGTLKVVRSVQTVKGQGLVFSAPKSDKSRRLIILPALVVQALRQHRTLQAELRQQGDWQDQGLVFTTGTGGVILPRNLIRHFKVKAAQAGLPKIRFHDLRHTAASLLLEQNTHPKVVQELLGHSQINLTLDTYSHVIPTLQREAAQTMDGILAGSQE
jgi:integrase